MTTLHTDILGTDYSVDIGTIEEIDIPDTLTGQCRHLLKNIKVEHSMRSCLSEEEMDLNTINTIIHEVFHAYSYESGMELPDGIEERLAVWFAVMFFKMQKSVDDILSGMGLDKYLNK